MNDGEVIALAYEYAAVSDRLAYLSLEEVTCIEELEKLQGARTSLGLQSDELPARQWNLFMDVSGDLCYRRFKAKATARLYTLSRGRFIGES